MLCAWDKVPCKSLDIQPNATTYRQQLRKGAEAAARGLKANKPG